MSQLDKNVTRVTVELPKNIKKIFGGKIHSHWIKPLVLVVYTERRGCVVVSTSACHAGGWASIPGPVYLCVFRMRH